MSSWLNSLQAVGSVSIPIAAFGGWAYRTGGKLLRREIQTQLAPLKAELSPNGGSSLRDKVNAIDEKVDRLRESDDRRHKDNQKALAEQQTRIEALEEGVRTIRRVLVSVLKPRSPGGEARIPGITDELLLELDRADEESGKYRRRRRPTKPAPDAGSDE